MSNFPSPIRQNGRLYFVEKQIDDHVRALAGLPPLAADPNAPVKLLTAAQVASRYGVGRRTIGRRLAGNGERAA